MDAMKRCSHCGLSKGTDQFHVDRSTADGLTSYCKACRKALHHEWFQRVRDDRIRQVERWRQENADAVRAADLARKKAAYATDPEYREIVRQRNRQNYLNRKAAQQGVTP